MLIAAGLLGSTGCVAPLTPAQQLSRAYVAQETGDVFTFSRDGSYTYTIGGPGSHAWHGFYDYRENGDLHFTYALSSHCGLWEFGQVNPDKSRLVIVCARAIGKDPAAQGATSAVSSTGTQVELKGLSK